jgi:hypothetical protein
MSSLPRDPRLITAITAVYGAHRVALLGRLRRSFPSTCRGRIEDAAQQAMIVSLEYAHQGPSCVRAAWERGGSAALEQQLFNFGWRHLRGERRRKRNRLETSVTRLPVLAHRNHPEGILQARLTAEAVERLLPTAARLFSKSNGAALTRALADRLLSGDNDKVVADRHGVERSLICRARNWLRNEVEG